MITTECNIPEYLAVVKDVYDLLHTPNFDSSKVIIHIGFSSSNVEYRNILSNVAIIIRNEMDNGNPDNDQFIKELSARIFVCKEFAKAHDLTCDFILDDLHD